jgi:hypothetical protein
MYQKTIKTYKLFRTLKTRKGELFPLFIGKTKATPQGVWIEAENIPTKGFAPRPGWHSGCLPSAPHLNKLDGSMAPDRVWCECEVPADVEWQAQADAEGGDIRGRVPEGGHYTFERPTKQGIRWVISGAIKINRILSPEEVAQILEEAK